MTPIRHRKSATLFTLVFVLAASVFVLAESLSINFESFQLTSVDGQGGWGGSGGSPVNLTYDQSVVTPPALFPTFGTRSFRMSNAVTSGSFGDWVFSNSLANEAGETSADNGGLSGGTRQPYFEAQWDFASAVPTAEQPGLQISTSPDRGDGARMSFIRIKDLPAGIQVEFADYQNSIPDFVTTTVATGLARNIPHTLRLTMSFVDGFANDVVRVYVDGLLKHTGTSWEDYFRDQEFNPTRPVDSLIFQARASGGTASGTLGYGFLIDNVKLKSGPSPAVYDCQGFDAPMNFGPVTVKKNRVLPLKAALLSSGTPVTSLNPPPVIQVIFQPTLGPATDVSADALSAGAASDGNQFTFDGSKWSFNLKTSNYSAKGTYTVSMVSGDDSQYLINSCGATFVIN